eukprot:g1490.t1
MSIKIKKTTLAAVVAALGCGYILGRYMTKKYEKRNPRRLSSFFREITQERPRKKMVSIVVHGGAWAIPDELCDASVAGVKRAASAGYKVLSLGGSALEAVEAAVRVMELDPVFDAGIGSVLNEDGDVEMDALIMDGATLNCGSVAGISNVTHPITAARLVKDKTDHVMFVGRGADKISQALGMKKADQSKLVTVAAKKEWENFKKFKHTVDNLFDNENGHDTVGAVAFDSDGHVACATSTGGITAKKKGRVGDSPLIGCGGYACDTVGAVSCTGHGESLMKTCLAHRILSEMDMINVDQRMDVAVSEIQGAVNRALNFMRDRVNGYGGVIAIDGNGQIGIGHTTKRMAWASAQEINKGTVQGGIEIK